MRIVVTGRGVRNRANVVIPRPGDAVRGVLILDALQMSIWILLVLYSQLSLGAGSEISLGIILSGLIHSGYLDLVLGFQHCIEGEFYML